MVWRGKRRTGRAKGDGHKENYAGEGSFANMLLLL